MVVSVANKGTPADGVVIDSLVDGSTDGTTTVSPAVENLAAVLGSDGTSGLEAVRGTILDVRSPDITVRHCSSCTRGNPGIPAFFERDLNSHIRGVGILVGGTGPSDVLVPVHLARGGPIRLIRVVSDATIAEDEVLIAKLLGIDGFEEANGADKAGSKLEEGHFRLRRQAGEGCPKRATNGET